MTAHHPRPALLVTQLTAAVALPLFSGICMPAEPAADCTTQLAGQEERAAPCTGLCVVAGERLVLAEDGSFRNEVLLRNRGPAWQGPLYVDSFVHLGTGRSLSVVPEVTGLREADTRVLQGTAQLATGEDLRLVVKGQLDHTGVACLPLRVRQGGLVASLLARRERVPFRLRPEGAEGTAVRAVFFNGGRSAFRIRNDDGIPYRFRWRFDVAGDRIGEGVETVDPGGIAVLPVEFPIAKYSFWESGLVRAAAMPGQLFVRYEPDESFRHLDVPAREWNVETQLNFWSSALWQNNLNRLVLIVVLVIGVLMSLVVNFALPTERRRIALKQRLVDLEGRLHGFAEVLSSRILSQLRAEVSSRLRTVQASWPVVPETELVLAQQEQRTTVLEQLYDLAARAGDLLKAAEYDARLAHGEIETIESACRQALAFIDKAEPNEDAIRDASACLASAEAVLRAVTQVPSHEMKGALLARRNNALQQAPAYEGAIDPSLARFQPILADLRASPMPGDGTAMEREDYVRQWRAVARAEVALRYLTLVHAEPAALRADRVRFADDIHAALTPGPGESLRRAAQLVLQAEQNVQAATLVQQLREGIESVRIEVDPPRPAAMQLVTLRVRLNKPGNDTAAARKDIQCRWTVDGHPLEDAGWNVSHFFELSSWRTSPSDMEVRAELSMGAAQLPGPAPVKVQVHPARSFASVLTRYALVSLALTIGVISVGLLTAAEDKIRGIDWLAALGLVFALGFGADVAKRLLAKAP